MVLLNMSLNYRKYLRTIIICQSFVCLFFFNYIPNFIDLNCLRIIESLLVNNNKANEHQKSSVINLICKLSTIKLIKVSRKQ